MNTSTSFTVARTASIVTSIAACAAIVIATSVGCGGKTSEPSGGSSGHEPGSEEANPGHGEPPATNCPEFLGDCALGHVPGDTDGDGCLDGCVPEKNPACTDKPCSTDCTPQGSDRPFKCTATGACIPAEHLSCDGKNCPPRTGSCPAGKEQADTDGDGCPDACVAVKSPACNGKTCGSDCTPAGSDEPFKCDDEGACVPVGTPVDCN